MIIISQLLTVGTEQDFKKNGTQLMRYCTVEQWRHDCNLDESAL